MQPRRGSVLWRKEAVEAVLKVRGVRVDEAQFTAGACGGGRADRDPGLKIRARFDSVSQPRIASARDLLLAVGQCLDGADLRRRHTADVSQHDVVSGAALVGYLHQRSPDWTRRA